MKIGRSTANATRASARDSRRREAAFGANFIKYAEARVGDERPYFQTQRVILSVCADSFRRKGRSIRVESMEPVDRLFGPLHNFSFVLGALFPSRGFRPNERR